MQAIVNWLRCDPLQRNQRIPCQVCPTSACIDRWVRSHAGRYVDAPNLKGEITRERIEVPECTQIEVVLQPTRWWIEDGGSAVGLP